MIQFFPAPKVDAFNALNRVKGKYPHEGGYIAMQTQQFQGNATRVVISARILPELLAGRMTYNEFAERYGFVPVDPFPARGPNPFTLSVSNGALITDVDFQKGNADSDDDAVIITLNDEADPVNAVRRSNSKRFTRGFLVVTPGLTIKDRLRVLQPNDPDNYYDGVELVPGDMLEDLKRARGTKRRGCRIYTKGKLEQERHLSVILGPSPMMLLTPLNSKRTSD